MSTGTIDRTDTGLAEDLDLDKDDADRFKHYVKGDKLIFDEEVQALCGKTWTPRERFSTTERDLCPACKDAMDALIALYGDQS